MKKQQQIEVVVHEDGKIDLRMLGFEALSCIDERKKLMALLGQAGVNASIGGLHLNPEYERLMQVGQVMCG
jgi:S-methylmethionine-dependent homocysteine/selenocysteine methylase